MAGSSLPGSRITSCQLAARSQAKSSTRVVPCQVALVGLRAACGARGRRSSIEKSSIPVVRAWRAVGEAGGQDKQSRTFRRPRGLQALGKIKRPQAAPLAPAVDGTAIAGVNSWGGMERLEV